MKHFLLLFTLLSIAIPQIAISGVYVCQPEDMSDAEAERITAIATELGESFRDTINEARSNGVTLRNDTTRADILANPEQAFALAKERYERQGSHDLSVQIRLDQGEELDDILHEFNRIHQHKTNYITMPLDEHLKTLAVALGGLPTDTPFEFMMDPKSFVFAMGKFAEAGELNFGAPGWKRQIGGHPNISFSLYETWSLFRQERFLNQRIELSSDTDGGTLSIVSVWISEFSYLDRRYPPTIFEKTQCLTNFLEQE